MVNAVSCGTGVNPAHPRSRAGCIVPARAGPEPLLTAPNPPKTAFPRYMPLDGPRDDSALNPGIFMSSLLTILNRRDSQFFHATLSRAGSKVVVGDPVRCSR